MKRVLNVITILFCSILMFLCVDIEAKAAVTYYDSEKAVVDTLRNGMKGRKETITIGFTTKEPPTQSMTKGFMTKALKHTGVPTEGDYLNGHYVSHSAKGSYIKKQGIYYCELVYKVKYRTTSAQEKATDKAVKDILSKLNLKGKDSITKIKTIYDYICENVSYDWANVNNASNTIKHTAYAAAVKGKSVCQGYSLLFYRLCLESGVDARVIEGTGKSKSHSWNIVKLNGKYYYVDATWDSESSSYKWFLKGTKDFPEHKADSTKGYRISATSYSSPKVKVKLSATTYTYNGKVRTPSVILTDKNGKLLVKGRDYKVSYSNGRKYVGKYAVKITLLGKYWGAKTEYFIIRPAATKITSLTKGSKSFTVKYAKRTTQTTGYQIQYGSKMVTVKNNKTISKKITGLKANTTYTVRVRTYKTVKYNGKSIKIYSAWSESKKVKTK